MVKDNLRDTISEHLDGIRSDERDLLHPPILALGISERVGSNWLLDTLNSSLHTHNEPFRQQLHRSHPLSTLSIDPIRPSDYDVSKMHPYELHWFRDFVTSKYDKRPHVLKETNLFFSARNLLDLFPDAGVVMLTRDPVGIASSFAENNLFERWNYNERYNRLKDVTMQPEYDKYKLFFRGDGDSNELRKLVRLIMLNTHLLDESLEGRDRVTIGYEESVTNRAAFLSKLSNFLADKGVDIEDLTGREEQNGKEWNDLEGYFNTRKLKKELIAHITPEEVEMVKSEVENVLDMAADELPATQFEALKQIFGVQQPYEYMAKGRKVRPETRAWQLVERPPIDFVYDEKTGKRWLNQPVSNSDFVAFLNTMQDTGVSNVVNGTQLFVNENMISERGGRIRFNADNTRYEVVPEYENYPAYWVTWLGAASYARYKGCRLPDKHELKDLVERRLADMDEGHVNAGHKQSDASPIGYFPADHYGMYDLIGNVASWCRDGSDMDSSGPSGRYMFGSAWNRDDTQEEYLRAKERPITGCSRGVGIRLIEDADNKLSPHDIADRFQEWYSYMAETPTVDGIAHDRYIIDRLAYS